MPNRPFGGQTYLNLPLEQTWPRMLLRTPPQTFDTGFLLSTVLTAAPALLLQFHRLQSPRWRSEPCGDVPPSFVSPKRLYSFAHPQLSVGKVKSRRHSPPGAG